MIRKGILTRIGETIDGWRSEHQIVLESQSYSDMSRSHRWLRWFLPTPGNVIFTLLVIGSLLWAQSVGAVSLAAPAVNSSLTIPYQGRLANASGTPFTGNQNMEFRLYNVPSGGTPLWSELWTGGNSVTVNDGLFSVLLGSLTAGLPAVVQGNGQLWLGITVGTDGEMSPRVQLGSAAYSMQALTVPDGSITQTKAPTLLKAAASLDGGGQNWKFQTGEWCINLNANEFKLLPVTFGESFTNPPLVFAQVDQYTFGNTSIHVAVTNAPRTTGTDLYVYSGIAQTICGHYLALGR